MNTIKTKDGTEVFYKQHRYRSHSIHRMAALWMTGLLLGVNLIFTGVMNVLLALASRTIASR